MSTGETFPVHILSLDAIEVDQAIQSRVETSMEYQREFSEAMLRGDTFPSITVFFDGKVYWLADGFHRYGAARQAAQVDSRFKAIKAEIRDGTRREATVFSAGANQKFSIPRTKECIRKAIEMVLSDEEGFYWTEKRIATHVGTGHATVRKCVLDYCEKTGRDLPAERVAETGKIVVGGRFQCSREIKLRCKGKGQFAYYIRVGKKDFYLGKDRDKAQEKADAILAEADLAEASSPANETLLTKELVNVYFLMNRGTHKRLLDFVDGKGETLREFIQSAVEEKLNRLGLGAGPSGDDKENANR